jgi:hypothetical protein
VTSCAAFSTLNEITRKVTPEKPAESVNQQEVHSAADAASPAVGLDRRGCGADISETEMIHNQEQTQRLAA